MSVQERLYTVAEFEQIADTDANRDRLLELINGEISEKVPTEAHGLIAGNIFAPLWNYNQARRLGRVVMEVRYRYPADDHNARIPDVSFSLSQRPLVEQGSVPALPDLAVEVKSATDSLKKLREKARYYLAHGVRLVWLVDPEKQLIEVYTPDDEFVLTAADTLTGGDLLPDFTLPVRAVFADPASDQGDAS